MAEAEKKTGRLVTTYDAQTTQHVARLREAVKHWEGLMNKALADGRKSDAEVCFGNAAWMEKCAEMRLREGWGRVRWVEDAHA